MIKPLEFKDDHLLILDQRLLPQKKEYVQCKTTDDVAHAIKTMKIRGAPAIGLAAAYALVLECGRLKNSSSAELKKKLKEAEQKLLLTRPTAVNLFYALKEMMKTLEECKNPDDAYSLLLKKALSLEEEEKNRSYKMAAAGIELILPGSKALTHCNTGSLATVGPGTALGVLKKAWQEGLLELIYVDETRPLLQGSRLTALELEEEGINYKVITDNTAAMLMAKGEVDFVMVGADRIASNGDTANKIGTYSLAVNAYFHHLPFYVVAPWSTFDFNTLKGEDIAIEEREAEEVKKVGEIQIAPFTAPVYNPAFDVTPSYLTEALITDKGIIYPPFSKNLLKKRGLTDEYHPY